MINKPIADLCAILETGLENMRRMSFLDLRKAVEIGIKSNLLVLRQMKVLGIDEEDMHAEDMSPVLSKAQSLSGKISDLLTRLSPIEREHLFQFTSREENKIRFNDAQPLSPAEFAESKWLIDNKGDIVVGILLQAISKFPESKTLTTSADKESLAQLSALKTSLQNHIGLFQKTHDLTVFKASVKKTFEDTRYGESARSFYIQAYDACVTLFRAFFRLFDYLVTAITRAPALMCDTETPLAKKLTGRPHFFEYYPLPKTLEAIELKKLQVAFDEGVKELDDRFKIRNDENSVEAENAFTPK